MARIVAYTRVSTAGQQASGLGLGDQRRRIEEHAQRAGLEVVEWFQDVESGGSITRPGLAAALDLCELTGATLTVATLDRLTRDPVFLEHVKGRCEAGGFSFTCLDMPDASPLVLGIMAQLARHERERIGQRTKAALAEKRAQGFELGNPQGIAAIPEGKRQEGRAAGAAANRERADAWAAKRAQMVQRMRDGGASHREIAEELTRRGIRTPRGGQDWGPGQVGRLLRRLELAEAA